MTDRKFTAPEEFPAEYVDGRGDKAVILGIGPNKQFPFIGYTSDGYACSWTKFGRHGIARNILHDIPKRITTWHNVYLDANLGATGFTNRDQADKHRCSNPICVYRIERDEDGGNHEIFMEEV